MSDVAEPTRRVTYLRDSQDLTLGAGEMNGRPLHARNNLHAVAGAFVARVSALSSSRSLAEAGGSRRPVFREAMLTDIIIATPPFRSDDIRWTGWTYADGPGQATLCRAGRAGAGEITAGAACSAHLDPRLALAAD